MTLSCLSVNLPIALGVQAGQHPLSFLGDPIISTNDYKIPQTSRTQRSNCCLSQLACLPYMLQHCTLNAQSKHTCAKLDNTIFIFYNVLLDNPALTTGTNQKICKHRLRTWIAIDIKNESMWLKSAPNSY